MMNVEEHCNEAVSAPEFIPPHSTSKNLDNSSPVSARDCRQQEVNGDVSSVIHPSSPDTTTPTTSVSALETDQDKVLAEVVAAAKARNVAKILDLVSNWAVTDLASTMSSITPSSSSQTISTSTAQSFNGTELTTASLHEGITSMVSSLRGSLQESQSASPPTTRTQPISTDTALPAPLTTSPSPSLPCADTSEESSTPQSHGGTSQHQHEEPSSASSQQIQLSSVNAQTPPSNPSPQPPPSIHFKLTSISAAGELQPVYVQLPNKPLVILKMAPLHGLHMGQQVTLSVPTQLILKSIEEFMAKENSDRNGPITIPLSLPPFALPSACASENHVPPPPPPPPTALVPHPPLQQQPKHPINTVALPVGPKLAPSHAVLVGARKMRAIAPKPSNAAGIAQVPIAPGCAPVRPSGAIKSSRKIFSSPMSVTAASMPFHTNKTYTASILRRPNVSNSPSRNRNRRKPITSTTVVTASSVVSTVAVAQNANSTAISVPTSGYIIDPNTAGGTGGFIQPMIQPNPATGHQFFTQSGHFFIPVPIGGVLSADAKVSGEAETNELHIQTAPGGAVTTANPYQSGFLVSADGSNDGFSQQVTFTNGSAPNGQFILPSYQTAGGEYVQQFTGQATDYLQSNGGDIYVTSDSSGFMSYPGIIGQAQPMTTVDLKDDELDLDGDKDDIIKIAMRVACGDQAMDIPDIPTAISQAHIVDTATSSDANGIITEFIQSAETNMEEQVVLDASGDITPPCDQQTSTGDAKIDALLAEAARISSVNGVGDNQSAVSVPVTSLLTSLPVTESTTVIDSYHPLPATVNTVSCSIAVPEVPMTTLEVASNSEVVDPPVSSASDLDESFFDCFANFNDNMVPHSSTEAATEVAFSFVSQKVNDFDAVFGPDNSGNVDASSFLKSLEAEIHDAAACDEGAPPHSQDVQPPSQQYPESKDCVEPEQHHEVDMAAPNPNMDDFFQLPFSRQADASIDVGDDDEDVFFPFTRDYTTAEQFDEALQLLGSPPQVIENDDETEADNASVAMPTQQYDLVKSETTSVPENSDIAPADLTLHNASEETGPSTTAAQPTLDLSLYNEEPMIAVEESGIFTLPAASTTEGVSRSKEETANEHMDEEDDDDSGSELDFLPGWDDPEKATALNRSPSPVPPPRVPTPTPTAPPRGIEKNMRRSARTSAVTTGLSPLPRTVKSPKHSTPSVCRNRRQSLSTDVKDLPSPRVLRRRVSHGDSVAVSPLYRFRSSVSSRETTSGSKKRPIPEERVLDDSLDETQLSPNLNNVSMATEACVDEPTEPCVMLVPENKPSPPHPAKRRRGRPPSLLRSPSARTAEDQVTIGISLDIVPPTTTTSIWNINHASRPTSFGFERSIGDISLPVPVADISSTIELRVPTQESFWGPVDDTDDSYDSSPHDTQRTMNDDVQMEEASVDSSQSTPTPELFSNVTGVSLSLNLPANTTIPLPANGTAFTRFAESQKMPTFEEFIKPVTPTSPLCPQHPQILPPVAHVTPVDDVKRNDNERSEGSDSYGDDVSPTCWLHDADKLTFSDELFPPKFVHPLANMPHSKISKETSKASPLISQIPLRSPAFGDNVFPTTSSSSIAVSCRGASSCGFAAVAAFRSPSFSALAAKASLCIGGEPSTVDAPPSFSDIARAANDAPKASTIGVGNSTASSNARQLHQHYHMSPLRRAPDPRNCSDPVFEEVIPTADAAVLENPPLQAIAVIQPNVHPPASLCTVVLCNAPQIYQTAGFEIIDLPARSHSAVSSPVIFNNEECKAMSSPPVEDIPPPRIPILKLKLPALQFKLKPISGANEKKQKKMKREKTGAKRGRKSKKEQEKGNKAGRTGSRLSCEGTEDDGATSTATPSAMTTATATVAPPIWAASKRGRRCGFRGFRGASMGLTASNRGSCDVAPPYASPPVATPVSTSSSSLSKKFFSSSKEDRRSSAIKSNARLWRLGFGSAGPTGPGRKPRGGSGVGARRRQVPAPSMPPPPQPLQTHPTTVAAATTSSTSVASNPPSGCEDAQPQQHLRLVIRLRKVCESTEEAQEADNQPPPKQSECKSPTDSTGEEEEEESEQDEEEDPEAVAVRPTEEVFAFAPDTETYEDANRVRIRRQLNLRRPPGDVGAEVGGVSKARGTIESVYGHVQSSPLSQTSSIGATNHPSNTLPPRSSTELPSTGCYGVSNSYSHRPPSSSTVPVFSPQQHQQQPSTSTAMAQVPVAAQTCGGSARSSSTASGSLLAPSTISPPSQFAPSTTVSNSNSSSANGAQMGDSGSAVESSYYQQRRSQLATVTTSGSQPYRGAGCSEAPPHQQPTTLFSNNVECHLSPATAVQSQPPTPSAAYQHPSQYSQHMYQQHSAYNPTAVAAAAAATENPERQAMAVAYAAAAQAMSAMWAKSLLQNYQQQQQLQQSDHRGGGGGGGRTTGRYTHQQPSRVQSHEQHLQQPVFPPCREQQQPLIESRDRVHVQTVEAHQQQHYPIPEHFGDRSALEREMFSRYQWQQHAEQQQHQTMLDTATAAAFYSSQQQHSHQSQQQLQASHHNHQSSSSSTAAAAFWYANRNQQVPSGASVASPSAPTSVPTTSDYPQIDNPAAVAAGGYHLSGFRG